MSTSPSVVSQEPSLYEDDLHEWASRQAALIREKRIDEPILCILLKNLMTLGSELYRRLESAFTVLFAHMLKWDHQPESRSRIWEATIREQRKRIVRLLEKNPSLRSKSAEAMAEGYEYGRDRASGQSDLPLESFPEKSNYSTHDVMDREFHLDESDLSRGNGPGKGG